MKLSIVPHPPLEPVSHERVRAQGTSGLRLFDVDIPADLTAFGQSVRVSALGDASNVPVVVLGGISADCFPAIRPGERAGWWSELVGEGRAVDPRKFYVIGFEFAADETGSNAPSTVDQAKILTAALEAIGIVGGVIIVGASYGGMVGLALAAADPDRVDKLVAVCAAAAPHPASTAARELQRRVVSLGMHSGRGGEALAIARGMAMLTYRTPDEFQQRFAGGICGPSALCCSEPGAYLGARGQAFRSVMSPGRFLSLSASIDRHSVDVSKIAASCLLIGARSDQLVLPTQLQSLAAELRGESELYLLDSLFGHDMFLKEAERIGRIVAPFLAAD